MAFAQPHKFGAGKIRKILMVGEGNLRKLTNYYAGLIYGEIWGYFWENEIYGTYFYH